MILALPVEQGRDAIDVSIRDSMWTRHLATSETTEWADANLINSILLYLALPGERIASRHMVNFEQ